MGEEPQPSAWRSSAFDVWFRPAPPLSQPLLLGSCQHRHCYHDHATNGKCSSDSRRNSLYGAASLHLRLYRALTAAAHTGSTATPLTAAKRRNPLPQTSSRLHHLPPVADREVHATLLHRPHSRSPTLPNLASPPTAATACRRRCQRKPALPASCAAHQGSPLSPRACGHPATEGAHRQMHTRTRINPKLDIITNLMSLTKVYVMICPLGETFAEPLVAAEKAPESSLKPPIWPQTRPFCHFYLARAEPTGFTLSLSCCHPCNRGRLVSLKGAFHPRFLPF